MSIGYFRLESRNKGTVILRYGWTLLVISLETVRNSPKRMLRFGTLKPVAQNYLVCVS